MRFKLFFLTVLILFITIDSMKRPLVSDKSSNLCVVLPKEIWIHIIACSSVKNRLRETCLSFSRLILRTNREILLHDKLQLSDIDLKKFIIYHADCGDTAIVKNMLLQGADPNESGDHRIPLIDYAIRNNDQSMIEILAKHPDIKSIYVIRAKDFLNNLAVQKKLNIEHGIHAFERISDALMFYVKSNNGTAVDYILSHKIRKDMVYTYKKIALSFGSEYGSVDVVRSLLQQKVDPNFFDAPGCGNPLHTAACHGHTHILKLLIAHGARVNSKNYHGFTALHCAVRKGNINSVQFLIHNDAFINARGGKYFETPLMMAVELGYIIIVELLMAYGADINKRSRYNDSVLHYAAYYNRTKMTYKLLSYPDINSTIENNKGQSPLDIAINNRNIYMTKLLVNKSRDEIYEAF
jgi:ankyrin repeat protein